MKKAVLDEQAKNNELNDTLRGQNQKIRKTDQEMEALKFRNSQLSVRITVLQDEVELQKNVRKLGFEILFDLPSFSSLIMLSFLISEIQ